MCLPENLGEKSGSPGDLAASPLQSVLLITALELLKIQRRRMLHQTHAGKVAVALGEEAVDKGTGSPQEISGDREGQFQNQQPTKKIKSAAPDPIAEISPGEGSCVWATTSSMMSFPI
ncbi:hypothetical protein MAE02_63600 [Microvirga aerophila]|uniref:Uncharacterized protein n=1 Tax=Microvirga aerophila TaxID=670291 RepID=A0A512C373_9HYPH|nr:hypothetical protein MAE02_63600 [Microvirga aerophila]